MVDDAGPEPIDDADAGSVEDADSGPVDDADARAVGGPDAGTVDDRNGTDEEVDAVTAALPADLRREHLVRAGHVVGLLVLLAVVIPFVLYVVPQLIGAEYSYVVTSGSMAPTLQAYDVVFVDAVEPGVVERGDIINFDRPSDDRTTTHRVIEVVGSGGQTAFRTAGDNNEKPDNEIVTAEQLRGRVMHVGGAAVAIPWVGRVIGFASGRFGFVLLFVVPVTLLIANEVYNFVAPGESGDHETSTERGSGPEPGEPAAGTVDPVAVADGQGANGQGANGQGPDGQGADGVSFSPAELKLGTAILGAFLVYSGWMAISDPGAVTVGVAGSVTVALFMLGGLYWRGTDETRPDTPRQTPPESADEGVFIRTAPMDAGSAANSKSVDTLATLIETSEAIGRAIYRTPDGDTYYLPTGSTAYVYEAGSTARASTDATDAQPAGAGAGEGAAAESDDVEATTSAGHAAESDHDETNSADGGASERGDEAGTGEGDPAQGDDVDGEDLADETAVPLADEPMPVAGSAEDRGAEAADEQREQKDDDPGDQDSGADAAGDAEDDAPAPINPDSNVEADDD